MALSIRDWLSFADRDNAPYHPVCGQTVTTHRSWDETKGDVSSPGWLREGWTISAALIPAEHLEFARDKRWENDFQFELGWCGEVFSFAESDAYEEIDLYPWCFAWRHPVHGDLRVQLRDDFLRYHALDASQDGSYRHPLDQLTVASTGVDSDGFYDPTPHATVEIDYLRDYLWSRGFGLLIRIIADRYANTSAESDLGVQPAEALQVDAGVWITTIVSPVSRGRTEFFRGRSILYRSIVIPPYDEPRTDRTPWPYFYARSEPEGLPLFIMNDQGDRRTLEDHDRPAYLHFRPAVLQKYLTVPGCSVCFHMRHWGRARALGASSGIDVGINSRGLVNAFTKDLADLRPGEQAHWASYSSQPSGEVCEEMFLSQMQNAPPDSPSLVDLVRAAIGDCDTAFHNRFGADLYGGGEPSDDKLRYVSVGPVNQTIDELYDLARTLNSWVTERMQVRALRAAIGTRGQVDKQWGQIKLLDQLLCVEGHEEDKVARATDPLRGLNKLRIASAHSLTVEADEAYRLMGAQAVPRLLREAWLFSVDSIVGALRALRELLRGRES